MPIRFGSAPMRPAAAACGGPKKRVVLLRFDAEADADADADERSVAEQDLDDGDDGEGGDRHPRDPQTGTELRPPDGRDCV
jgi:hypothetical protein